MKHIANTAKGFAGITVLTLMAITASADSVQYSDVIELELDMGAAAIIAIEAVNGSIVEAELEIEDGKTIWEIDIVDENNQTFELCIDGQSGRLVSMNKARSESYPTDVLVLSQAISSIATSESGTMIEAELELEDARWVWELEALSADNHEKNYYIDAKTGEML